MTDEPESFMNASSFYCTKASKPLNISSQAKEFVHEVATDGLITLCKYLESVHTDKDAPITALEVEKAIKALGNGQIMMYGPQMPRTDPEVVLKKLESTQTQRKTQKKAKAK